MNTKMKFQLLAALFILAFAVKGQDQKTKISLEIDPATFVFNGYSGHIRIQPRQSEHMLYGAGIYAMDMLSVFVNLNPENRNENWDVRLNLGYGLFGEYHFREVNQSFFTGAQVSIQDYKVEQKEVNAKAEFSNILAMPYFGYTLQPFEFPLYFKLWGGVGYTSKISGSNELQGQEYDVSPIAMFATFHVGYTFMK